MVTKHPLPLLIIATKSIHCHYLPWQHKASITITYHGNTKHPLPLLTMATQRINCRYLPWQHKASIAITHHGNTKHPLPLLTMATQNIHYHYLSWQYKTSITITYHGNTKHPLPLLTMAAQSIHCHYAPWQHKLSITITYHDDRQILHHGNEVYVTMVTVWRQRGFFLSESKRQGNVTTAIDAQLYRIRTVIDRYITLLWQFGQDVVPYLKWNQFKLKVIWLTPLCLYVGLYTCKPEELTACHSFIAFPPPIFFWFYFVSLYMWLCVLCACV